MEETKKVTRFGGVCPEDNAQLKFVRCTDTAIYFECVACGHREKYIFNDENEANEYFEEVKADMIAKVKLGLLDWQRTQWDVLHRALAEFVIDYPRFEMDIHIQMANIACITRGFQMIDDEKYKECKIMFSMADKVYKARLKVLKRECKHPVLPNALQEYSDLRDQYLALRNKYLETKIIIKILMKAAKFATKPFMPI